MSRRDGAIVAWHEVPGTAPPQKSRPVGYGVGSCQCQWSVARETLLTRRMPRACCEMSQRDDAIVAWHEVPGTTPPQKSRPVGYGLIRAAMRAKFDDWSDEISLRNTAHISARNTSGISCARSYRTLQDGSFEGRFPRHSVPGYDRCCPSGARWQTFRNPIS
jgi:hypothetical protein